MNKTIKIDFEEVKIFGRNFAGKIHKYNKNGKRSFKIRLSDEDVKRLAENDIKCKTYELGDGETNNYIVVSVNKYSDVKLLLPNNIKKLEEDELEIIDGLDIEYVDCIVNFKEYTFGENISKAAYLLNAYIKPSINKFEQKYKIL